MQLHLLSGSESCVLQTQAQEAALPELLLNAPQAYACQAVDQLRHGNDASGKLIMEL